MRSYTAASLAFALLAGCARTPPVTLHYPLATSALELRLIRTVGCDSSNMPVIANTVTSKTLHTADVTKIRSTELGKIDGALANSELKAEFYPDGRLKGVNATTVGQGETIIKAAIKLAETAADASLTDADRQAIVASCTEFKKAFADKVLTLGFELRDDLSADEQSVPIPPDDGSRLQYLKYRTLVGDACLRFGEIRRPAKPTGLYRRSRGEVTIKALQPALVEAVVTSARPGRCRSAESSKLWTALVPAAQHGEEYEIPIPRAAFFGKQVFAVALDESGALTSLQYNKDSGAGGLLNTAQAGLDALQTTKTEEIAALKSEADLIAAQQRLVRCQTSPATCQ